MDKITVRMLPGQRVQDYVDVADRLAQTFGALDCRVRTCRNPHRVQLWLLICDPLAAAVDTFDPADTLADGLPVARAEDGSTWLLRLLGNHVLIVGATGAGKSGVLWAIIAGLASLIRAGLVKVGIGVAVLGSGPDREAVDVDRLVERRPPQRVVGRLDHLPQHRTGNGTTGGGVQVRGSRRWASIAEKHCTL
jgi:hypothetical protein